MSNRPSGSPWGKIQTCKEISPGVYEVGTEGHGGIMVDNQIAEELLSSAAIELGDYQRGFSCYEEDCMASIVIRELLDKDLLEIPPRFSDREAYETIIDESLRRWNPDYWQKREDLLEEREDEAIQELNSRIEKNMSDYKESLMSLDKRELIEMANKIAVMNESYEFMTVGHGFSPEEAEYLLRFQNPLQIMADNWTEHLEYISDDMCEILSDFVEKQSADGEYPLMSDESVEPEKTAKPSILGQIKSALIEPKTSQAGKKREAELA